MICTRCGSRAESRDQPKWHEGFARFLRHRYYGVLCDRCAGNLHWEYAEEERKAEASIQERARAGKVGNHAPQPLRASQANGGSR